jgi:hypothetical protein
MSLHVGTISMPAGKALEDAGEFDGFTFKLLELKPQQ